MAEPKLSKGYWMEEELRHYFLRAGYYVLRGAPLTFSGEDVTDIDLWLYSRTSSISREIAIVDIKNKKAPQAMERILWVNSLKEVIGADKAIVATTDRRALIADFGKKLDVMVLNGNFISKLPSMSKIKSSRLTEEELINLLKEYDLAKLDGDWKTKVELGKSLLIKGLSFDSANSLLGIARFFAEQLLFKDVHRESVVRCFYLVCSYLSICIDFILKELSFFQMEERTTNLLHGFTYGSMGKSGLDNIVKISTGLIQQFVPDGEGAASQLRVNISKGIHEHPSTILAEFFSRNDVGRNLFNMAKLLESSAMEGKVFCVDELGIEVKSLIGCLCDYWELDRVCVFEKLN